MPGCSLHALLPLTASGCELHTSIRLSARPNTSTLTMGTALLPTGGIALVGAPDSDLGPRDAKSTPVQAMQVEMTQDIVDELLASVRSGKPPQIFFGRTPVRVQTFPEACRVSTMACRGVALWWLDSSQEEGTTLANHARSNSSTATRRMFSRAAPRATDANCTGPAGLAATTSWNLRDSSTTTSRCRRPRM